MSRRLQFEPLEHRIPLALDVNGDGFLNAMDALIIVNALNDRSAPSSFEDRLDVNGDGHATPADALAVINVLNDPDPAQCWDGRDNDGNRFADHPEEPGCASRLDRLEELPLTIDDRIDATAGTPVAIGYPEGHAPIAATYPPSHGTLSGDVGTYTPADGFVGTDVFVVVFERTDGERVAGRYFIDVAEAQAPEPELPPAEEDLPLEIDEMVDTIAGTWTPLPFPEGYIPDGLPFPPQHGTVSDDRSSYRADATFAGQDVLVVTLLRPDGARVMARYFVDVVPPLAQEELPTEEEDLPLEIDVRLSTFVDNPLPLQFPDGYVPDGLPYPPGHGTLTEDRSAYVPDDGFAGSDVFVLTFLRPDGERVMGRYFVDVLVPTDVSNAFAAPGDWWNGDDTPIA